MNRLHLFKKAFICVFALGVLMITWAALHDITKGEEDPYGEVAFLSISAISFIIVLILYFKKSKEESAKIKQLEKIQPILNPNPPEPSSQTPS